MTKEEAIEEVKNYDNYPNGLSKECRDYIIKTLEQEPVIDELRAEIITLQNRCNALTKGTMCMSCTYECEYKSRK